MMAPPRGWLPRGSSPVHGCFALGTAGRGLYVVGMAIARFHQRRILVPAIVALLLAVAAWALGEARPSILYILTDQQHAGMMSCAGNQWLKTPAMDSLSRNGTRFERAYSVNPVCVPSRVAMFTGCTPSRFGMQSNREIGTTKIPAAVRRQVMGWLFRNAGYETAYGGKTHVPGKIEDYGFDVITADSRDELAAACATFLKKRHDRPFLLVASFINPHDICYMAINDFEKAQPTKKGRRGGKGPHQACLGEALACPLGVTEKEFVEKLCPPAPANLEPQGGAPPAIGENCLIGFRKHAFDLWSPEKWRLHRWAYCRLTERVDREIGVVLAALREAGLENETLVVFSSDHGDMDGAHRLEHKSTFYEEAARVPFIVSLKGATRAGLVDREHVVSAGLDLIPTFCDFAGVEPPEGLMGHSVRALCEGRSPLAPRPYVASETHFGRMICSGRYKYCVYATGDRREQLVDLERDGGEMRNIVDDPGCADVLTQHRQFMREWVTANQDSFATAYIVN